MYDFTLDFSIGYDDMSGGRVLIIPAPRVETNIHNDQASRR
jgi:hypothetical protein